MSGIEQMGQLPGFGSLICGCIGQVHTSASGAALLEGTDAAVGGFWLISVAAKARAATPIAATTIFVRVVMLVGGQFDAPQAQRVRND